MVTKKYEHIEPNEFATFLSEDIEFQGNLEAQDSVFIEGSCNDSILKGTLLIVSGEGHIQGKVIAECLVISGVVDGKVSVSENLHVLKGGEIKGSLSTTSFVVDEGAIVNATCYTMVKLETKKEEVVEKKAGNTVKAGKKS